VAVGQHVSAGQVIGTEAVEVQSASSNAKSASTTNAPTVSRVNITAPVSGDVATTSVAAGQDVAAGTPLVTLVQLNTVYVTANITETNIRNVHRGESVNVTVNAVPGVTFHGTVTAVAPATQSFFSLIPASATAGTYVQTVQRIPVNIRLHTMGYTLLPGESCSVRVHT
jgi:multidrug resistance efflux pump